MTVQPLHPAGLVSGCVSAARGAVRDGLAVPSAMVDDGELAGLVGELAELESQVVAWRLRAAAEADRRRLADQTADTDTAAWLARLTQDPREVAAGGLWLAKRLEDSYAATRNAFAAGRLRTDQVRVIVGAAEKAPTGITAEQLARAEEALVAKATGEGNRSGRPMTARRLRLAARRMFEIISRELADAHESDQLVEEERQAERETWFRLTDNGDGTCSGGFVLPELHGRLLRTWLDRLTAPRKAAVVRTEGANGSSVTTYPSPAGPAGSAGPVDPTVQSGLSYGERAGLAFAELIEHLPVDGWGAGSSGIGILVSIDLEALRTTVGAAGLDTGTRCSASEARRLACSAGIIPAVLGGESMPLDLGRSRRLHSEAQRRALALVHDTCAVTTCERPFAWTEVHHPHAWSAGGPTDLRNALPLCAHHHRRAHDDRFELRQQGPGDWRFRRRSAHRPTASSISRS